MGRGSEEVRAGLRSLIQQIGEVRLEVGRASGGFLVRRLNLIQMGLERLLGRLEDGR